MFDNILKIALLPAYFKFIISLWNETVQFDSKLIWKNVHLVSDVGIRTCNLMNNSIFLRPLDQDSRLPMQTVQSKIC